MKWTLCLTLFLTLPVLASGPDKEPPEPLGKIGKLDFSEHRGKVVLIDFWATWCKPCRMAAPTLAEINEQHQDNPFVLLSITTERDAKLVKKVAEEDGMDWLHYMDQTGKVTRYFGVRGLPTYVLIDHEGRGIWMKSGWSSRVASDLRNQIDRAVAKAKRAEQDVER